MDEHTWETLATHQALIGMSDNPRQFRGVSPSVRLMDQTFRAWRAQRFGDSGGFDAMAVKF